MAVRMDGSGGVFAATSSAVGVLINAMHNFADLAKALIWSTVYPWGLKQKVEAGLCGRQGGCQVADILKHSCGAVAHFTLGSVLPLKKSLPKRRVFAKDGPMPEA